MKSIRAGLAPIVFALVAVAACGDPYQPTLLPVPSSPEEGTLHDFVTGSLQDPSAFDGIGGEVVRTDQSPGWDFLFVVDPESGPAFRPRGGFLDDDSQSGIQTVQADFTTLATAPDAGYRIDGLLPISQGDVLAFRSRRDPAYGSVRCRYYGKMEIVSLDAASGSVEIAYIVNPNCEKRQLLPENN